MVLHYSQVIGQLVTNSLSVSYSGIGMADELAQCSSHLAALVSLIQLHTMSPEEAWLGFYKASPPG